MSREVHRNLTKEVLKTVLAFMMTMTISMIAISTGRFEMDRFKILL